MLHEDIRKEMQEAMKAKDEIKLSTMRMLMSSITNTLVERDKKPSEVLEDEAVVQVIKRLVKQRKESAAQYREVGKDTLANQEDAERAFLEVYLPDEMSAEEVMKIVVAAKEKLGITEKKDKGTLMKEAMQELKGKVDGKVVADVVDSVLE